MPTIFSFSNIVVILTTLVNCYCTTALALVNVQPCIISPWAPFQLHGDYATYAFPELAAQYWPDLNVSHMKVIGNYFDSSSYDVAKSYMAGDGGTICDLVIGPGYSDGCIAISPLIGKPLWIDFASTSTQLSSKTQFPNFLRVVSTDEQGGTIVATLLKTFNWKNIFVIKSDDSYGSTYTAGVATAHTKNGGQIIRTFNLIADSWSVELFKSTLLAIHAQKDQSRVVVVVGISVSLFSQAVRSLDIDSEMTFIFSDYACSADSPWAIVKNAFCITVDLDQARWANFTTRYQSRSDVEFNRSAEELYKANYPESDVISQRNEFESFTALSVDAVFFGLAVLQKYQSTHNRSLPSDSVEGATFAISANVSMRQGMTGVVGVDANGDRASFISAIHNSNANGSSQIAARDYGDGQPIIFSSPVNILNRVYDLNGKTDDEIAASLPSDRAIYEISKSNDLPAYAWVLIAIVAAALACILLVFAHNIYRYLRRGEVTKYAPKSEEVPVAIIFTDIESSTALWAECPQQMVTALDLHNTVIRKCIAEHRGYEVKTIGDSFMIAFGSAVDAVQFSLAMQKALHAADWSDLGDGSSEGKINGFYEEQHEGDPVESPTSMWNGLRVRVGGHFGLVSVRRTVRGYGEDKAAIEAETPYDYFGSTVNVAARIEAIGHGGQVLVSKALLDAYETEDYIRLEVSMPLLKNLLGSVDLRGYNEAVSIIQLVPHGLVLRKFSPLRTEKAAEELPSEVTSSQSTEILTSSIKSPGESTQQFDIGMALSLFSLRRKMKEEDVRAGYFALDALTSIMPLTHQRRYLRELLKEWHINDGDFTHEGFSMKNSLASMKIALAGRFGPLISRREAKALANNNIQKPLVIPSQGIPSHGRRVSVDDWDTSGQNSVKGGEIDFVNSGLIRVSSGAHTEIASNPLAVDNPLVSSLS